MEQGSQVTSLRTLKLVFLSELVVRYRDQVVARKRYLNIETILLNACLKHPICETRLDQISQGNFSAYRDHRLRSVSPRTVRHMFSPLHNMIEIARTEWHLSMRRRSTVPSEPTSLSV